MQHRVTLQTAAVPGILFVVTYNFRYKLLDSKIINLSFLLIILFAFYVHIYQLFFQKDLVLASIILILADIFIGYKGGKRIIQRKVK